MARALRVRLPTTHVLVYIYVCRANCRARAILQCNRKMRAPLELVMRVSLKLTALRRISLLYIET